MATTKLWLQNSGYYGSLPAAWSQLTNLQAIDLSNNALTGTLPPEWSGLTVLLALALDQNYLTGPLPPSWSSMAALKLLALDVNTLSGTLPAAWCSLADLSMLFVSNNPRLCGAVPECNVSSALSSFDGQGRLHCETGAAMRYPDGFSIFAIHDEHPPV